MNGDSKNPLVSVVLPTHNRSVLLVKAIASVFAQTWENLEVVVVDDASKDTTQATLTELCRKDERIHIVINPENIGFVKSLNKGIRYARGVYIARLDDDDHWCDSRKLEKQVMFLEQHPEYVLVGGGVIRVNEEGKELSRQLFPEYDDEIRRMMLQADPFVHPSVLFRRDAYDQAGGYDETFEFSQDWELWMRLGRFGKYYNFPEYFVRYLQADQNRSQKNLRRLLAFNLVARKRHRNDFPNFWRGYSIGCISYVFSFVPIRYRMNPLFLRIKRLLVG